MKSPAVVRQFFKTVLQQVYHLKVDDIAGDANGCSIQVLQKLGVPRSVRYLSWRHAKRDATRGQYGTPIWKQAPH